MYVIIRSRMTSIRNLIGRELSQLSAIELENVVPNLATIYLSIRSRMSLIMEQIKPQNPELFALEFVKTAETTLFTLYRLQILTNQHQTWSKCM